MRWSVPSAGVVVNPLTVKTVRAQRERNNAQFDIIARQLRKNARCLKWYGWVPVIAAALRYADQNLREAEAELRYQDSRLEEFLDT